MDLVFEAGKKIGGSVATNIVFPLGTDSLTVDGKPVTWEKDAIKVSSASVIGLREGRAAIAMRIFHADGAMAGSPVFYLRNDGKTYGAGRLVAYHARGHEGVKLRSSLLSGVLILATECATEEEFAKFFADAQAWKVEDAKEGGLWKATASGPSLSGASATTALAATLDLPGRIPVNRWVNGAPYQTEAFTINGHNISSDIWGKVPEVFAQTEGRGNPPATP
jgi:hypothetical protein